MSHAAHVAELADYYWVIRIAGGLATVLLLLMIRFPAALIIIALLWLAAWMVGAL